MHFLQEKDETTRHSREDKPKIQKTREASVYKRTLRLQDTREMTSLMRTRRQTWNTLHGSHCLLEKELAEGQLQTTREAPDYKRRMRLQDTREMTSLTRTGTQTWNTCGQGRRHGTHCLLKLELAFGQLHKTRAAPDYKRKMRLQDMFHDLLKLIYDRRLGGVSSPLGRPPRNREIVSCRACVRAKAYARWKCISNVIRSHLPFSLSARCPFPLP